MMIQMMMIYDGRDMLSIVWLIIPYIVYIHNNNKSRMYIYL